jgi:CspA family cold shock protein
VAGGGAGLVTYRDNVLNNNTTDGTFSFALGTQVARWAGLLLALGTPAGRPVDPPGLHHDGSSEVMICHTTCLSRIGDDVASGTVKWFNPTKGYGFVQPSDGGKDVFVHISAVEKAGLSSLNEGQQISYDIVSNRGKESAENIKVK